MYTCKLLSSNASYKFLSKSDLYVHVLKSLIKCNTRIWHPICKTQHNYVDMRLIHVNMRVNYVDMRHIYVHMQLIMSTCKIFMSTCNLSRMLT